MAGPGAKYIAHRTFGNKEIRDAQFGIPDRPDFQAPLSGLSDVQPVGAGINTQNHGTFSSINHPLYHGQ
jgi:hypothetical protein